MGKGKKNNRPNRYTGKNVNPMGDSGRMEHYAVDVFRNMNRGRYDFNNISEFENRDFVYAAIKAAERQYKIHDIHRVAIEFTYGNMLQSGNPDPDIVAQLNIERNTCRGWGYIVSTLYKFMNTNDFGSLVGMAQQLSSNRNLRL